MVDTDHIGWARSTDFGHNAESFAAAPRAQWASPTRPCPPGPTYRIEFAPLAGCGHADESAGFATRPRNDATRSPTDDTRGDSRHARAESLTTNWVYDTPQCNDDTPVGRLSHVGDTTGLEASYCYDPQGRLKRTGRLLDGTWHYVNQTYDAEGRLLDLVYPNSLGGLPKDFDQRLRARHDYDDVSGHLTRVFNYDHEVEGEIYWTAEERDARGRVTSALLGNGIETIRDYYPSSGLIAGIYSHSPDAGVVQDLSYAWDEVGNLESRVVQTDPQRVLTEAFSYDGLHRLAEVHQGLGGAPTLQASHAYDRIGNLTAKGSSHTGYDYQTRAAGCSEDYPYSQPHAVKQLSVGGQSRAYCYDARGNITRILGAGVDQEIEWTRFDQPSRISGAGHSSAFRYDHERLRWKQERISPAGSETRYYVEGLYERVVLPTLTEHVHYIRAGGETVAIVKRWNTDEALLTRWVHRDHLGSIVATSPAQAVLAQSGLGSVEYQSYDAWGQRRDPFTWAIPSGQPGPWTDRGYTEHEHLDELGLIHMNGRVYSPELGRFLSADPYVQFPDSSQGLNRYSYVLRTDMCLSIPTVKSASIAAGPLLTSVRPGVK